ncbi:flagellar FlbD family protein [Oscillospiraceae bacterium OttesenSCG-928-F05]|nr:flagellar FlbD family protein [Oscillospiraceae bacterium OttesenSCG-928-F05]
MVEVTRLNGKTFFVNPDLVEFIEETPDTVLTLINGQKLIVTEGAEEVVSRIVAYKARIGIHLPVVVPRDGGKS